MDEKKCWRFSYTIIFIVNHLVIFIVADSPKKKKKMKRSKKIYNIKKGSGKNQPKERKNEMFDPNNRKKTP